MTMVAITTTTAATFWSRSRGRLHLPGFTHDHSHADLAADRAFLDNRLAVRTVWIAAHRPRLDHRAASRHLYRQRQRRLASRYRTQPGRRPQLDSAALRLLCRPPRRQQVVTPMAMAAWKISPASSSSSPSVSAPPILSTNRSNACSIRCRWITWSGLRWRRWSASLATSWSR